MLRQAINDITPKWLRWKGRRLALALARRSYRKLSVSETFRRVYATGEWGNGSGRGSDLDLARDYIEAVRDFICANGIQRVLDVGCGDFRVGSRIADASPTYIGVDVVPEVVDSNRRLYPNTEFLCADLLSEDLPDAELCLVRQVFQHLSNAEIERALERLKKFPLVLVTEQVPAGSFPPNYDKPHGPDTRLFDGSGVVLSEPPFSVSCDEFLSTPFGDSVLRTVRISNRADL